MAEAAGAKYTGGTLSGTANLYTFQGTLSGDVVKLPAGTMQYAAGYQFRRETLKTTPAAALEAGDISGLGGATLPIDADRNINALFAELNIPIIKNLDGNLALRWDDYSDVGIDHQLEGQRALAAGAGTAAARLLRHRASARRRCLTCSRRRSRARLRRSIDPRSPTCPGLPDHVAERRQSGPEAGDVDAVCAGPGVPADRARFRRPGLLQHRGQRHDLRTVRPGNRDQRLQWATLPTRAWSFAMRHGAITLIRQLLANIGQDGRAGS